MAVVSPLILYYGYAETPPPALEADTLLRNGLGKTSSLSQTRDALLAQDFLFSQNISVREVSSTAFYAKEKEFLSRVFEMFDFYEQSGVSDLRVLGALRTMQQFLESDVARWTLGDRLRF